MVGEIERGEGGGSRRVTQHEEKREGPRPLGSQAAALALGVLVLVVPFLWVFGHLGVVEERAGAVGVWGIWLVALVLLGVLLVRLFRS
jgi:hypothetical protein